MDRILEEKPVRRALAKLLGIAGSETRVEKLAKRYKEQMTAWSKSTLVEQAAESYVKRLKARSEAPWIQWWAKKYSNAMRRILRVEEK